MKVDTANSWIKEYPNRRYKALLSGSEFISHQREFHILAFISAGDISLKYRARNVNLSTGDAMIIPAGEIHSFSTREQGQAIILFHYIDTLEATLAHNNCVMPKIDNVLAMKKLLLPFTQKFFDSPASTMKDSSYKELLGELMQSICLFLRTENVLSDRTIQALLKTKAQIENNIFLPFCLTELSEQCEIDKWQLSRKFKMLFGVSLFQYIHATRVVKAKDLLSKNFSIANVAHECGYADQSHFTRVFKRFVGISPKTWEKFVKNN